MLSCFAHFSFFPTSQFPYDANAILFMSHLMGCVLLALFSRFASSYVFISSSFRWECRPIRRHKYSTYTWIRSSNRHTPKRKIYISLEGLTGEMFLETVMINIQCSLFQEFSFWNIITFNCAHVLVGSIKDSGGSFYFAEKVNCKLNSLWGFACGFYK